MVATKAAGDGYRIAEGAESVVAAISITIGLSNGPLYLTLGSERAAAGATEAVIRGMPRAALPGAMQDFR